MKKISDTSKLKGMLSYRVYRKGKLIEEFTDHNLIVNWPRNQVAKHIAGDDDCHSLKITHIAFGTNGTLPEGEDTGIADQFIKAVTGESSEVGRITFNWELLASENNGMDIFEFGLLTEDGNLFCRKTREKPLPKDSDISLEGSWVIQL